MQAEPDLMPIEFLVVGGSIAGLSAAIALRRAGHKVTVFDIENPFEATPIDAGCRLPPNSTKMYYRWGLEERLHACAVRCKGTIFAQYDSGSVVGSHEWQEDVLLETGGDFLFIHYTDIRRILAECAAEHGATIRYGPENTVAKITAHATRPSIELTSGEVLTADVVVGADGYLLPGWIARKYLLEAHEQEDTKKPTGMQMFNVVVREADMVDQGEHKEFLEMLRTTGKVVTWYGSKYGAFAYPMVSRSPPHRALHRDLDPQKTATTGEPAFTLYVYAPLENEGDPLLARNSTRDALLNSIKGADPRLMQLAKHAAHVAAIPMVDHPMLEDWVHPDGRFICIGEAAHPTQVGSVYAFGMSTGDAAVLGRLFKYLHRPEQIDTFLSAVQEIRESRVQHVMKTSAGNIFAVSLPPGMAEARDRRLQERAEEGIAGLASGQTSEQMIETVESVFAYDPEDQADNWWVEWGVMQERAERWSTRDDDSPPGVDFGVSVSTTVDS
ncbi:FAD/NAD(P)-binding domain-containing protein [Polyporus arcularius HHB13444]|uniref:FAD/NAD(P)-binding domain-containing protein n=1 Tax=Polyporus arcularius HHB13444 TaxID=1314778 RepID=A0A5C3NZ93_9APHY|nr:FAD/NAD(P)-binding domain-containing protein [Polyporus arcularius HHB13444]